MKLLYLRVYKSISCRNQAVEYKLSNHKTIKIERQIWREKHHIESKLNISVKTKCKTSTYFRYSENCITWTKEKLATFSYCVSWYWNKDFSEYILYFDWDTYNQYRSSWLSCSAVMVTGLNLVDQIADEVGPWGNKELCFTEGGGKYNIRNM